MGSSQSILSPEAAVTVAVVAGAVGLGYSQFGPSSATTSSTPTSTEAGGKKGKKKKKTSADPSPASEPSALSPPAPIVVPFPTVIPGALDGTEPEPEPSPSDAPKSTKSKKKKKNKLASSMTSKQSDNSARPSHTESKSKASGSTPPTAKDKPITKNKDKGKRTTPPPSTSATSSPEAITRHLNKVQSSISIDTDGSWTRVESRRNKSGPSVDITTSASEADPATGTSSPVAERTDIDVDAEADVDDHDHDHFYTRSLTEERRPLAERMLPKPRKTGVESMLETPDHPTVARVMRVQPQADEQPALGFSWGDYEDAHDADADGEDDNAGWDVVKSRRSRPPRPSPSDPSSSLTQSHPKKAPETLTKRQRQNASRRSAQKALKEEAEHERRAVLARHQRELEGERMREQQMRGKGGKGGKGVSGGMKAVVSDGGKLV